MNNDFQTASANEQPASNDNMPITQAGINSAAMEIVEGMINWENLYRHDAMNVTAFDWERFGSILNRSLKNAVPDMKVDDDILNDFTMWLPYTRDVTFVRDTIIDITQSHLTSHFLDDIAPLRSIAKSLKLRLNYISRQQMEPITPSSDHHIALMIAGSNEELTRKRDRVDVERARDAGLDLS